MENEETVVQPQVDQETTPEKVEESVETKEETKVDPNVEALRQVTARAKRAEAEKRALEAQIKASKSTLDVEDYIDISASLDGLDQREKEKLASEHKMSGKPLKDIRESEDFQLWDSAYRQKVEKERLALKPTGTQTESDRPQSLADKLANASQADKEKILAEAGLYKSPRPRLDKVNIGAPGIR